MHDRLSFFYTAVKILYCKRYIHVHVHVAHVQCTTTCTCILSRAFYSNYNVLLFAIDRGCIYCIGTGIVGLNNIKANDYMNVVLHALAHAVPFRNYFLREENYQMITPPPGDQTITLGNNLTSVVHMNIYVRSCLWFESFFQ